jgi:hypothetical protein
MRVHVSNPFLACVALAWLLPVGSPAQEAPARVKAYHVYDQRATVVDMESMMRSQQPDPKKTPATNPALKTVLREEYRRDKQFGFRQVETLAVLPSQASPDQERARPESTPTGWLKPGDVADKENIEPLPEDPDVAEEDVQEVVPWKDLTRTLAEEALAEGVEEKQSPTAADEEKKEEDAYGRNNMVLPSNGLALEPVMGMAAARATPRDAEGAPRLDRREEKRVVGESAMGLDRVPFESARARELVESYEKDDFSRTQMSMRAITAPWQGTRDAVLAAPAAPSAAAWTPTRAVDLPTSDLAGNAAVRSVTRVSAMEVSRPLPSMEMPRIPTVQDPLARRALDAEPSARQPVAPPPAFRRDEFRISPGMGDGFPMGNFR